MALDIAEDKANTASCQHWAVAVAAVDLLFVVAVVLAAVAADTDLDWMSRHQQHPDTQSEHGMNSTVNREKFIFINVKNYSA